jgi:hypothetical protein
MPKDATPISIIDACTGKKEPLATIRISDFENLPNFVGMSRQIPR